MRDTGDDEQRSGNSRLTGRGARDVRHENTDCEDRESLPRVLLGSSRSSTGALQSRVLCSREIVVDRPELALPVVVGDQRPDLWKTRDQYQTPERNGHARDSR